MASDQQLIEALVRATEKLLKRSLTAAEREKLIASFNETSGSTFSRAQSAMAKVGGLTESEILQKSAASDDTDRVMDDLKEITTSWKPGT